jgi:DNA polymerase-3 subunit beta
MAVHDIRYLNGFCSWPKGKQLSLVATDGHRLAFRPRRWTWKCRNRRSSCRARRLLEMQRLLSDKEGAIDAVRRQPGQVQFDGWSL